MTTTYPPTMNVKNSIPIPKYTTYYSDGFGRDTYILSNNGGFLEKLDKVKSVEKFDINSNLHYCNTRRNVAPLKYHSDGSGRDNYVLQENGGLVKDFKSLRTYHLKDFLRDTTTSKFNFSCDPMKEGVVSKTLYISKNQYNHENQKKSLEKSLADRLYYSEQAKFIDNKTKKKLNFYFYFIFNTSKFLIFIYCNLKYLQKNNSSF